MNKLFITVATIGALAIAGPAFAQRTGPGPTAETGTGPGVIPPGGYGPSSSALFNLNEGLPGAAPSWMGQDSAAPPVPPGTKPSQVSRQLP
jgi:hypothetical protein